MKKNLTELVFIIDRSGSMHGLEVDTIGGFNAMIDQQKQEEGQALISTVLFDTTSRVLHDRVPLGRVAPMTCREYRVGGCTALLDAVGDAIHHIANVHKYAREEDIPEHTMFVITTDGMENASSRYSAERVREMIDKRKTENGWKFLFLGANIDAVQEAKNLGIEEELAATYCCDSEGTRRNYEAVSEAASCVRGGRTLERSWKQRIEDYRNGR